MSFETPDTINPAQEKPEPREKTADEVLTTEVKGMYVQFGETENKPKEVTTEKEQAPLTQTEIADTLFPESAGDESKSNRRALEEILQKTNTQTLEASALKDPVVKSALTDLSKEYILHTRIASSGMQKSLDAVVAKASLLLKPPVESAPETKH